MVHRGLWHRLDNVGLCEFTIRVRPREVVTLGVPKLAGRWDEAKKSYSEFQSCRCSNDLGRTGTETNTSILGPLRANTIMDLLPVSSRVGFNKWWIRIPAARWFVDEGWIGVLKRMDLNLFIVLTNAHVPCHLEDELITQEYISHMQGNSRNPNLSISRPYSAARHYAPPLASYSR